MTPYHFTNPVAQRLILIAGIGVFVVLVFPASFASMWELWQASDHSYGLLVFPISAFLIWRLRYQLNEVPLTVDPRGFLVLAPLAFGWIVAKLAGIQAAEHFLVLAMIPSAILVLVGWGIVRDLKFPLLFLLLAAPFGDSLVPHLMVITADISSGLLRLSGFPFLRNGQYISLPGGEFVVADVCSGVRYLSTGLMVALLFAYLTYTSIKKQLLFVMITVATLVMANGVRAYIVMAVASSTQMQYLGGRDHIYFGWILFGFIMMLLMWLGARYADENVLPSREGPDLNAEARGSTSTLPLIAALGLVMLAVTVKPLRRDFGEIGIMLGAAAALVGLLVLIVKRSARIRRRQTDSIRAAASRMGWVSVVTVVAVMATLILTPRYVETIERGTIVAVHSIDLDSVSSCTQTEAWEKAWKPKFRDADFSTAATLTCLGHRFSVFVAAYGTARQGRELVSTAHRVVPEHWENLSSRSTYLFQGSEGQDIRVLENQLVSEANSAVVWHWYEVDGHVIAGPVMTKIRQLVALAGGRPSGGRVVVLETAIDGSGVSEARNRLAKIANELIGAGAHVPVRDDR